jgi:hypothetical protein
LATRYLALLGSDGGGVLHLVREDAEVSLCGLPRATLSARGRIDDATVCRECIDWIPRRWTGSMPKASRG